MHWSLLHFGRTVGAMQEPVARNPFLDTVPKLIPHRHHHQTPRAGAHKVEWSFDYDGDRHKWWSLTYEPSQIHNVGEVRSKSKRTIEQRLFAGIPLEGVKITYLPAPEKYTGHLIPSYPI